MSDQTPMKILVVEADPVFRREVLSLLTKAFPNAEIHPYDLESLGPPDLDFNWSRFDVLLLDFQLGENDNGLDWLRLYKKETSRFPATIMLTEADHEEIAVRALRYGAHDFLRKSGMSSPRLAESIADALNVRYRESSAESSLTLNASKFSKSFFYGQLDLAFEEAERNEPRALLFIRVDGYEGLRKTLGVIAMEDVTRYLANAGIEVFRFGSYRPRATRFSDSSIGILVGGYENKSELERKLSLLCERIADSPPIVKDAPVPVTVSIGAVIINARSVSVYDLFELAERSVGEAATEDGNSFVTIVPEPAEGEFGVEGAASMLDAQAAMDQNRIYAMFAPITSVSDKEVDFILDEFFEIDPYFISPSGESFPVSSVLHSTPDSPIWRLVDRWSIRECFSRLLPESTSDDRSPAFLIDLSDASSTDEKLPHWAGKLLKHHGIQQLRGEIFLAISPTALMRDTKKVVAICQQLQLKHRFRFAIKEVGDAAMCKVCIAQFPFDLVVLSSTCSKALIPRTEKFMGDARNEVSAISTQGRRAVEAIKLLQFATQSNVLTLVRGIENAGGLHAVISAGVDFVQGDFIAPEQEEIEAAIGIERVQLNDTGEWRL